RWFTRGWSLRALIALTSFEFFFREGKQLDDKRTLDRRVSERIGVAVSAFQGTPLSQFGVDE
ncbi:hypothetical protein B0O99DRAFT_462130, partial [Bisporella sp. PMI_857]